MGSATPNTEYGTYRRLVNDLAPSLICPTSVTKTSGTYNGTTFNIGSLSKYTAKQEENNPDNKTGNGMLKTVDGNTTKYYKVGLLTADEVTFAGAYRWTDNKNYYLVNNTYWWTMSPSNFYTSTVRAYVWYVYPSGHLFGDYVAYSYGVRPAVSLKSTASISGGTGTATDPYVISV